MQNKKGFTIIELIVVIAIIAILAAIVMVNVVQYINKSKDAANLANLKQLSFLATQYYTNNNESYSGLCDTREVQNISAALNNDNNTLWCRDSANYWIAFVEDKNSGDCLLCADALGNIEYKPCYASSPLRCKI